MPRKGKPTPPPIDWAEFVEAVRRREWARRFNRPSQMLERHSRTWREPDQPPAPPASLFERMRRLPKRK